MRKEASILQDVPKCAPQWKKVLAGQFQAVHIDRSLIRHNEADHQAQESGFATTTCADQQGCLTSGDRKAELLKSKGDAIGLCDPIQFDHATLLGHDPSRCDVKELPCKMDHGASRSTIHPVGLFTSR